MNEQSSGLGYGMACTSWSWVIETSIRLILVRLRVFLFFCFSFIWILFCWTELPNIIPNYMPIYICVDYVKNIFKKKKKRQTHSLLFLLNRKKMTHIWLKVRYAARHCTQTERQGFQTFQFCVLPTVRLLLWSVGPSSKNTAWLLTNAVWDKWQPSPWTQKQIWGFFCPIPE